MSWITSSDFYVSHMKNVEVGYVFIANLIASFIVLIVLIPEVTKIQFIFDKALLKKILKYSLPLLIVGLAGIFNETIDRILLRKCSAENLNALYEIGIYGANYRIAVLMTIFVQMFRYAAEPFFFNFSKNNDSKDIYANVLKYFTIFLMVIFLGVALCIDFFKLFISKDYYEGLRIVPVVLFANVLVGILFNVNMWYKLSGHTLYGVFITGIGALITVIFNIALIPRYGYNACAWIHILSNLVMIVLTYIYGQRIFRINYDLKKIVLYISIGLILFIIGSLARTDKAVLNIATGTIIVLIYLFYCNKKEKLFNIFLSKNES
jgi:O-antigen/teichoic acid export membrane protein